MRTFASSAENKIDVVLRWHPLYIGMAIVLLFLGQIVSGTSLAFATMVLVFNVLTAWTIQVLGGLGTLMGVCVLFIAAKHIIISQVAKICYWQPAQSTLQNPLITMGVYDVSMAAMVAAAYAWRFSGLQYRKPLLKSETDPDRMYWFAIICMVLEFGRDIVLLRSGVDAQSGQVQVGGTVGPLRQAIFLGPLCVAYGTAYMIRISQGRKSLGWINALPIAVLFVLGFIGAGREQMAIAFMTYYATCYAFRFKFRSVHYIVIFLILYVAQFILFPYALIARATVRTPRVEENVRRALVLIQDIVLNPVKYQGQTKTTQRSVKSLDIRKRIYYYGRPNPTLDRFSTISSSAAIIDATLEQGTVGMMTIQPGIDMLLPRFLVGDKPNVVLSNLLAHRTPVFVGKKDYITGIDVGFFCDAFSSFGWMGVVVIPFLILFLSTSIYRLMFDDHLYCNVIPISMLLITPWHIQHVIGAVIGMIVMFPITFVISYVPLSAVAGLLANIGKRRFVAHHTSQNPSANRGHRQAMLE